MKSILLKEFGGVENLIIGETEKPKLKNDELLIQVKCYALNRADIIQRNGKYPPPPGDSEILGLEISGIVVEETQTNEKKFKVGDRVFGLVGGGAYGEYCSIAANQALHIPEHLSFEQAASIPEAWLTAYQALHLLSNFKKDESVLIHASASGVGTALIQLCKLAGITTIIGTVGSEDKGQFIKQLGATHAINYKTQDPFLPVVLDITSNKGVNVVFDYVGQQYWNQNLKALQLDGTMIIQGFLSGAIVTPGDIQPILSKRLTIKGSTLRNRDNQYKGNLVSEFAKLLPQFESGQLKPIIDSVFDYTEIQKAHKYLESNQNKGKVVIKSFNY
ncbi:hypothetical protein DICPUDRAFT_74028 [Dictyostelium purpureum]|uniref:Enoyl reductase (ER) domain-containing protein n=1 Tax=Dictyostelium purpureum TaxID=5786 RepID=F0Z6J9_DICPU|nr:uncharacterized protein DICPUDRAFT_74028 [Dictyostelium purpureum]EGC40452.1 hypothetical protein DICPUDRAFT_74028 [Dictyostelium purpureum]|eukprot:XP_003282999.1 hypothetical protein DICPUDRAFT_74028 [Dictyostelium purpureum]